MAGTSFAEEVLRRLGAIDVLASKLYQTSQGDGVHALATLLQLTAELRVRAERRVDDNLAQHYRRTAAEGMALAKLPEQVSRG